MNQKRPRRFFAAVFASFMVVSSLCFARDTTQLPEVWTTVPIPEKVAYISVRESGHIRVSNGDEMSLPISSIDELHAFLATLKRTRANLPIVVKIDRRTKYKHVDPVFAALTEEGYSQVFLLVNQKTVPMDPDLAQFFQDVARN